MERIVETKIVFDANSGFRLYLSAKVAVIIAAGIAASKTDTPIKTGSRLSSRRTTNITAGIATSLKNE